jgi:hypothetical protein
VNIHDYLFWALVALQLADGYTTIEGLRSGAAREANPLLARLIGRVGRDRAVVGVKLLAIAGLWYGRSEVPLWMMGALTALYVYVIANNVRVIRGAAK